MKITIISDVYYEALRAQGILDLEFNINTDGIEINTGDEDNGPYSFTIELNNVEWNVIGEITKRLTKLRCRCRIEIS